MAIRSLALAMLTFAISMAFASHANAVTVQSPDDILGDGSAYLWLEAEDAFQLAGGDPQEAEVGFILVDKENPIQTIEIDANDIEVVKGGLDVLPADTNASGGAGIFAQLGGGGTANWQLQFALPATYYLYMHWSMYNRDVNTNYGNEDSFYVPPAFNSNSRDDWIGFEGIDTAGDPKTGDSSLDGYIDGFPVIEQNYVSAGEVEAHNSTDEDFYDGNFHWYWLNKANDMDENNAFVSFDGFAIQYEVGDADVGTVLDFEISTREPYGAIDGFLFSTSPTLLEDFTQEQMDDFFLNLGGVSVPGDFNGNGEIDLGDLDVHAQLIKDADLIGDVNGDGVTDVNDRAAWTEQFQNSWLGDSNFDGEFGSADFVAVFTTAKYETGQMATYAEGDWNGDMVFDSGDFVAVFTVGGYEKGQRQVANVPEPAGLVLISAGLLLTFRRRR